MTPNRHLPQKFNPLMTEEVPSYEVLVGRRRLGQTNLTIRARSAEDFNSSKSENPGTFDYVHLRVPIPKEIVSGIFNPSPPSYYLMRRSNDGYISATGMFKATFPYAELVEEDLERKYLRALPTTSPEETAGNIWIPPQHALELAEEYNILPWIQALIDNTPIELNTEKNQIPKIIKPPPPFQVNQEAPSIQSRDRTRRSVSPSKNAPPRKVFGTRARTLRSELNASTIPESNEVSRKISEKIPTVIDPPMKKTRMSPEDTESQSKTIRKGSEEIKIPFQTSQNGFDESELPVKTGRKSPIDLGLPNKTKIQKPQDKISFSMETKKNLNDADLSTKMNVKESDTPESTSKTTQIIIDETESCTNTSMNEPDDLESFMTRNSKKNSEELDSFTNVITSSIENLPVTMATDNTTPTKDFINEINEELTELTPSTDKTSEVEVKMGAERFPSQLTDQVSTHKLLTSRLLPPQETATLISTAKETVEVSKKAEKLPNLSRNLKRKAQEIDIQSEGSAERIDNEETNTLTKRQKIETKELVKERIKGRALLGITATLAIG